MVWIFTQEEANVWEECMEVDGFISPNGIISLCLHTPYVRISALSVYMCDVEKA